MNDARVLCPPSGEITVCESQEDVLGFEVRDGLLVCGFGRRNGGAFWISRAHSGSLRDLLAGLSRELGAESSFKIIGTSDLATQADQWIKAQRGLTVTAVVPSRDFEAYLYPLSGRVRLRSLSAQPDSHRPIRVLIVDDSRTIRTLLRQILASDPGIEVVGEAERPSQVEGRIERLHPDVITLDIHMPEMDGVTLLERYLPKHSIPTVMVTAMSMQEGNQVLRALSLGAVDYIQKPSMEELKAMSPLIIEKIKVAAGVKLNGTRKSGERARGLNASSQGGTSGIFDLSSMDFSKVLAIGASTGGVQALESVLKELPKRIPSTVIVQHIPPVFSAAFAKRLNDLCPFEVMEAQDGDELKESRVLIAPGGTQMRVEARGQKLFVKVFDGEPVNRHKPSVDVLFDSVAEVIGKNAVGVILTGMGADGAKGLLKMRQAGARTIAQDQESCVVFGMPRAAIELGAAEQVRSLSDIPEAMLKMLDRRKVA